MEICPSLFHIVPDKKTEPTNENDIFRPDGFRILQSDSLTRVKDIIAQTVTDQNLHIRLLCCYRVKDLQETYCSFRQIKNPKKQLCSDDSGLKTNFIHFHIRGEMKNLHCSEYLLAFIEGSDLHNNSETLVKELLSSIDWLEIGTTEIFLNVFTFGQPVFVTRNLNYLEELISSTQKQETKKSHGTIECKITHIQKEFENSLHISLRGGYLHFNPS